MADNYRKYRVYRKDIPKRDGSGTFPKYRTKIGVKDANGNWDNEFFDIEFRVKGGADIPNNTDILVPEGGDGFSFRRREVRFPDVVHKALQSLYQQDQQKFKYLMMDFNMQLENGKFIKAEPLVAVYRFEFADGGSNNNGWGNAPQPQQNAVPDGWGSAPTEEVPDTFSAAEDDIPF